MPKEKGPEVFPSKIERSLSRCGFIAGDFGLGLSATSIGSLLKAYGDTTTLPTSSGVANPTTASANTSSTTIVSATKVASITSQIIVKFKASHPNNDVKVELTPLPDYWTKLQAAAIGKTLRKVFMMNAPKFIIYSSNNLELHKYHKMLWQAHAP